MKYYFFDFCGTLTATNNTYDFIFFYLKKKKLLWQLLKFFIYDFLLDISNFILIKKYKRNIQMRLRQKIIFLFYNQPKKEIQKEAKNFFNSIKKKDFLNKNLIRKIRFLKKNKRKVYILSASIDPVINVFVKEFKIDNFYSSKLIYKNEKMVGFTDYLFKKDILIKQSFKLAKLKNSVYYTDNHEDKKFREIFKEFYFINTFTKQLNKAFQFSINKKNIKFTYFPILYYLISRPSSLIFFLLNELIVFFIFFRSMDTFKYYLIYFFSFYPLYEIGAFYNDYFAIKKEKKPTQRIDSKLRYNFFMFTIVRIFFAFLILNYLIDKTNIKRFILLTIFILIIFFIHSFIKNRNLRFITMFFLRFFKLLPFYFLISERLAIINFFIINLQIQILPYLTYIIDKSKKNLISSHKLLFSFYFLLFFASGLFFGQAFLFTGFYILLLRYLSFKLYLRSV